MVVSNTGYGLRIAKLGLEIQDVEEQLQRTRAEQTDSRRIAVVVATLGLIPLLYGLYSLNLRTYYDPLFGIPILTFVIAGLACLIVDASWFGVRYFRRWLPLERELESYIWRLRREMRTLEVEETFQEELRTRGDTVINITNRIPETSAQAEPLEQDVRTAVPLPPNTLVRSCASGECVLFAASGISAQAGLPTFQQGLLRLIDRADEESIWRVAQEPEDGPGDGLTSSELRTAVANGDVLAASEIIAAVLDTETLQRLVREIFGAAAQSMPSIVRTLSVIPFVSVLTTNWDTLLEQAFSKRRGPVLTPRDTEDWPQLFRNHRFNIAKLNGDVTQPNTINFTRDHYRRALAENPDFARYLGTLFTQRTILFAGATLSEIESFAETINASRRASRQHYALVPNQADIVIQRQRFLVKWGIELLVFDTTLGSSQTEEFITTLHRQVEALVPNTSQSRHSIAHAPLDRVELTNIGPLRSVELELTAGWNVILGNNGCGKSSLLKAIAVGLAGSDAGETSAASLLRADPGATSGSITLTVGKDTYRTELVRDRHRVRVRTNELTPLQSGSWVVLGFPPVRGVSSHNPAGPTKRSAAEAVNPSVEDVLPILSETVDRRLDDLKQWIVNTETLASDKSMGPEADRARALLTTFFRIFADLTPGLTLRYHGVDKVTWEVLVETDDGLVPLSLLSRGTSSVLGWVGTLLQRMYEIYREKDRPEEEPALVLIDEADAHLHPEWQRQLVPLVRKHFPALQVIVTTHSPLIVSSLQPSSSEGASVDQVLHLYRDEETRAPVMEVLRESFAGHRADQILTSFLFGLPTTRGEGTAKDIARYSDLLGQMNRTGDEEAELASLQASLSTHLMSGETPLQRRVEVAVEAALVGDVSAQDGSVPPIAATDALPPDVKFEIKRQLATLLAEESDR